MQPNSVEISSNALVDVSFQASTQFLSSEAKMELVLQILGARIARGDGYPFAAAIFDSEDRLVSAATNESLLLNNSTAHAELIVLQLVQSILEKPYLPRKGEYSLVSSAQPCAMCTGAIFNSGISSLVFGATDSDVVEIMGFGQGPVHPQWREFLESKKIAIEEGVLRQEARSLLSEYVWQRESPSSRDSDRPLSSG